MILCFYRHGRRTKPQTTHAYNLSTKKIFSGVGPIACDPRKVLPVVLLYCYEQADNCTKQGNTFNEGSCNQHSGTDLAASLRLTCNTFHGTLSDSTNADTGTNSCKASADCCTTVTDSHVGCCLQKNN